MYKKVLRLTLFIIFALTAIVLYNGHTEDWLANDLLPSSLYASTHGHKIRTHQPHLLNPNVDVPGTEFHVHCIAAADDDYSGYYNLHAQVEEAADAPWWVFWIGDDDDNMNTYEGGCREFASLHYFKQNIRPEHAIWKARAFIKDETLGGTDGETNIDGMVYED